MNDADSVAAKQAEIGRWMRREAALGRVDIDPNKIGETPEHQRVMQIIEEEQERGRSIPVAPPYGDWIAELEKDEPRKRYIQPSAKLGHPDQSKILRDRKPPDIGTLIAKEIIRERAWYVAHWWFLERAAQDPIAYLVWCLEQGYDPETGAHLSYRSNLAENLRLLPGEWVEQYPDPQAVKVAYRRLNAYTSDQWRQAARTTLNDYRNGSEWERISVPLWGFDRIVYTTEVGTIKWDWKDAHGDADAILKHLGVSDTPRRVMRQSRQSTHP